MYIVALEAAAPRGGRRGGGGPRSVLRHRLHVGGARLRGGAEVDVVAREGLRVGHRRRPEARLFSKNDSIFSKRL